MSDLMTDWKDKINKVDKYLRGFISTLRAPEELTEAISYVLFPGGKRIRPYLLLLFAETISANMGIPFSLNSFLPFASALELVHNYSLVHDDLPAMDNDDYRRGKLTPHKVYGEGKAVLLGDELLTLAFRLASGAKDFPPDRVLSAIRVLSKKSGEEYLIGGQWEDITYELSRRDSEKHIALDLETLRRIEEGKTVGLILATAEIPVVLLRPSFTISLKLIGYAYWLGYLFQVTDDMLDRDGFFAILGEKETKKLADEIYSRAVRKLEGLRKADRLRELAGFVLERTY